MEIVAYMLVSLACVVYLTEKLLETAGRQFNRWLNRMVGEAIKLHSDVTDEIRVPFELWWHENCQSTVLEAVRKKVVDSVPGSIDPDHIVIPDEVLRDVSRTLERLGLHLAVHAKLDPKMKERFGGHRRARIAFDKEHSEELESERMTLLDHGVDVPALEAHFSASN